LTSTVVFTVVFPQVETYLDDFFTSLRNQTAKDFDIFVANDGLENFEAYKEKYNDLEIREKKTTGTPAQVRNKGLEKIKEEGYQEIVFSDADDFYADNRVEKVKELLKQNDIVVNDLDLVDQKGRALMQSYLSKRVRNQQKIDASFVDDKNIFGLCNTAVKTQSLKDVSFQEECIAGDWYVFSRLLNNGNTAIFTNETKSYYRQHESNTIGMLQLSNERILKGVKAKLFHYKNMQVCDLKYAYLYDQLKNLDGMISSGQEKLNDYLKQTKELVIENPLWWENVQVPKETMKESKL